VRRRKSQATVPPARAIGPSAHTQPHRQLSSGITSTFVPSRPVAIAVGEIVRRDRLGGLVHEYERRAA